MNHCNTTCPYCGVGCGVTAQVNKDTVIAVMGDGNHPANAGRLCVKGTALAETLGNEGRLLHPRLHGEQVAWNLALETVADKLRSTRDQYGPGSIAFYLSGQLLTEDYYVANKLMKGFLGSANVDTNSRLCMSSAVAAYKRAFGEDLVPCSYEDLETCDLLVMVGSNAAWTHPVVYQRIVAAKQAHPNKRVVVIDTRRTATCDVADLHLQIAPGSDAFLFGGLLRTLSERGAIDRDYVDAHTEGFEESLAATEPLDRETVLDATGLAREDLDSFYRWFCDTERTVTLYSQGINQSATGTDKCNSIINCHLATGRIAKPGTGPFSITGQPNAMGGREVGGLANQLASHMDFSAAEIETVRRFWGAPDMATGPGLKAVDMFEAMERGEIKFLWVMATNPAVSLPDSAAARRALERCDFVVVSDCSEDTETTRRADLVLPAQGWGEKDGTVTNSERVISRQRALVPARGDARPDWWIVTEVARRLGFERDFNYRGPADIFREHAALSGFENLGQRAFDISALAMLGDADYETLTPVRWPVREQSATEPLSDGRFFTDNGRGRLVPVEATLPREKADCHINTGRLRDQWHTMTRTGRVPRLARHRDFFTIGLNPQDLAELGSGEGQLLHLKSDTGSVIGPGQGDPGLPRGQMFVPIHWSAPFANQARASDLMPAHTDPVSGQPQSKYAPGQVTPVAVATWGLLFSQEQPNHGKLDYWSRIAVDGGYLTLLADARDPGKLLAELETGLADDELALSSYTDSSQGDYRLLGNRGDALVFALFLSRERHSLPERQWLATVAEKKEPAPNLLAGLSSDGVDPGALVCSCWEVGEHQINAAIAQGAASVDALGKKLRCGTQCGSCIPELKEILQRQAREFAA